uniref:Uncharacterized protein n=1 Tax=Opuntia streptacantha TaxID=393608 RepID=A0A7C9CZ37_OPUST
MMDVRVAGVLGLLFYPSCLFVVSLSRWDWGGQGLFKSKGLYNGGPRKTKQVFVEVMVLEDLKCFTCRENRRQREEVGRRGRERGTDNEERSCSFGSQFEIL